MPSESLIHNLTMPCIGWVQVGGAWTLHVPSFHMCPKSACCLFVCHSLEACLHSLLSIFFDLFMWSTFQFLAPLRSWALFDNGPYISLAHFLIAFFSYYITFLFLL